MDNKLDDTDKRGIYVAFQRQKECKHKRKRTQIQAQTSTNKNASEPVAE